LRFIHFTIIIFLLQGQLLSGQLRLGMISDNYTPIVSNRLNPTAIVDQKPWMSIHIAGIEAYARNNLIYAENTKIRLSAFESMQEGFKTNQNSYFANFDANLQGPSVSFTYQKHALGIHSALRNNLSVYRLPREIGLAIESEDSFGLEEGIYAINDIRASALSWAEIGLTYGQVFKQRADEQWSWAITVNRLYGIGAGGLEIRNANLEFRDTLNFGIFANADASFFFTEPAFRSGKGWSSNLGVRYKKMRKEVENHIPHSPKGACEIPEYEYKIGISILDFGSINFNRNSQAAQLQAQFTSEDLEDVSDGTIADQMTIERSNEYKMSLPTALSVQFDYSLNSSLYLAATWIQNFAFIRENAVRRSNLIGASLRYESKWLGAAIPISMFDYRYPQIGASIRLGSVIVGSDHIVPFLFDSDIYASDIYIAIHIPILRNPSCATKGKKQKQVKSKEGYPPCPKW